MSPIKLLPCLDSDAMAVCRRSELQIPRDLAENLGRTAVQYAEAGAYPGPGGRRVDWSAAVQGARANKVSLPPEAVIPLIKTAFFQQTLIRVSNETAFGAARQMVNHGRRPVVLNFANGIHPGGGFLHGARAQEEVLCRSSALYLTLSDDPMYAAHTRRPLPDSTDWAIYSPDVPIFRNDDGTPLTEPWPLCVITCAAPYAPGVGQPLSRNLLRQRISRVLAIARAYGHTALVLGAWGCGAFGNDPYWTASDFWDALDGEFDGAFEQVDFAISDWSPERRMLGPFRDIFMEKAHGIR